MNNDDSNKDQEKQSQIKTTTTIEVPDGGYGWFVVLGSFLLNLSSFGANAAFSIYLAHYLEFNTFKNSTKLDYSAIGGLSFGSGLIISPIISILSKKFGIKICISFGTFLQLVGLILASFSKKIWQIYLTQGLLVGLGIGFMFIINYGLLPQWFRHKRSLATSIAAAGSGIGGIIFSLADQAIIKNINLRWAFIIQAICCTILCIIGIFLVKSRDEFIKPNFKVWNNDILKLPIFYLISSFIFFSMQGYVVLLYSIADFTKTLGYSSQQASIVSCMISVGATFGRPIVGKLSDKFGPVTTNIFIHLIITIFCFAMWIPIRNYSSAIAFALIQGSLIGSFWVVIGPITARVIGLRDLSTSFNMVWVVCGISTIIAPIIGIKLRGEVSNGGLYSTDQYEKPAIYCGLVFLMTTLSLWLTRGYLIARDDLACKEILNSHSHSDNGELHIKVPLKLIAKSLFKRSCYNRKV